ncbi:unnamed protein product [Schistosoma curassoni]|uniref:DUF4806 domain-containing protein n=1 Tax=Schistosoma curassoni TaxID=6186 RepID=A0A183JBI1_9TREM|nr:unnamed protein product [Schistosoma curassoni]
MEPVMELLDIHSDRDAFEDYFERFEIWAMTKEDDEGVNIVAHFLTFIGKEAYSLLKTLALPEKLISFSYTIFKDPLLGYVQYTNFECGKGGKFRRIIHVNFVILICNTNVHFIATNIKSCNSDSTKSSIYNDDLSLSTIATDSVESHSSSELNETQNSCETTVSKQSICQISHVIALNMVFPSDVLISDEISYKSEENMLNEPIRDRKPDAGTISEESNLDVLSNNICPHNAFVSCGKLVQCEAQVLNELDFDYNSDDFISTAVYPYHEVTSNVYSS